MDLSSLSEAIQSLVRLDRAGLLEEFQIDVAEACRGPADDLERHVEWKWAIHRFSRLAARLFDVPAWQAEKATKAALLPSTRQGVTSRILEQYIERLDAEELKEQAKRSTRRFNRKVGA
jgi:hypothetical protein